MSPGSNHNAHVPGKARKAPGVAWARRTAKGIG